MVGKQILSRENFKTFLYRIDGIAILVEFNPLFFWRRKACESSSAI